MKPASGAGERLANRVESGHSEARSSGAIRSGPSMARLAEGSPMTKLDRTKENPWPLKTPPGASQYTMHVEEKGGKTLLICTGGKTLLEYDDRCIDERNAMLKRPGDWVQLGGADEQ